MSFRWLSILRSICDPATAVVSDLATNYDGRQRVVVQRMTGWVGGWLFIRLFMTNVLSRSEVQKKKVLIVSEQNTFHCYS